MQPLEAHCPHQQIRSSNSFNLSAINENEVDAVVNSTNENLDETQCSPGLHAAAGPGLAEECATLGGCRTGMAKVTNAYDLPARRVIHTVGPKYAVKYHTAAENALSHCYRSCLELLIENGLQRSVDCFRLRWPMRADSDFFCGPFKWNNESDKKRYRKASGESGQAAKVNFVEIRSYWHVFRSFDRMWSFFILCLQGMIIVAWNGDGNPTTVFNSDVFHKVLSVFITASILKLVQAVLDVVLTWKARHCMPFDQKLRYALKVASAAVWVVILSVTYTGLVQTIKGWFGSPSLINFAVIVYLSPNMLAAVLFLFPFIRWHLESSDYRVVMLIMWWGWPRLYVGRGMQESTFSIFK